MPKYLDIDGLRTLWAQITNKISQESNATAEALEGKADLVEGKIPASQLPSYVDDVLEYTNKASFPATGESGKIYLDLATNLTYRWSGTAYTEISPSLALGTTSSTAYRGDYGAAAYKHAVTNKGIAKSSGLYKITTNAEGHVTAATAVVKADITGLGIPAQDTTYENATTTTNGLMSSTDKTKLNSINLSALVKSVNGITPDSNGNVAIEVGGGTVSGDYLPLTGGTLTGWLTAPRFIVQSNDGYPAVVYNNADGNQVGALHFNASTHRFYVTQKATDTNYNENYILPTIDTGLTENKTYNFLTTKSAVTIPQGGTGATTAAGALTNLGITATAAELNKLDGVTATTAELNYVDGVTSNIQTQLNGKAPTSHASTTTNYGLSTDTLYGHAMASKTTPKALGTAALGSETAKFARGDHVHPLPALTSCTGTLSVAKGGTGATNAATAMSNLKGRQIFTSYSQLGLTEASTSYEIWAALPADSSFIAHNSNNSQVTDAPVAYGIVQITKTSTNYGVGYYSNVNNSPKFYSATFYLNRTFDGWKQVITETEFTDNKVAQTSTNPTTSTKYYPLAGSSSSTTTAGAVFNTAFNVNFKNGTASAEGDIELILGNSTATGTAGNKTGWLCLYSPGTSYHMIKPASTNSALTHTLPAVSGTILNSGNYQNYAKLSNLGDVVVATSTPSSVTNGKWYLVKQG